MTDEARLDRMTALFFMYGRWGLPVQTVELCRDRTDLLAPLDQRVAAELGRPPDERGRVSARGSIDVTPPSFPGHAPPSPGALTPSPPLSSLSPAVPGYRIAEWIGHGSYGVVYKARHETLNRDVALKIMLSGAAAVPRHLARFRTEGEALARLQHPHIVQVFEAGTHEGLPFLALELCARGSLDAVVTGKPMPPRAAAEMVETLARAVHAMHDRDVVHRDLKPGNVMLAGDGTPKLADFGLARRLDHVQAAGEARLTMTYDPSGTPAYIPPEQAQGRTREAGVPADVYGLGAILYECLTGQPPHQGHSLEEVLRRAEWNLPVPPTRHNPKVPHALEGICLKCLEKRPDDRYPTALALAEELRAFRERGQVTTWLRRPAVAAVVGTAALLSPVALGGMVWGWTRADHAEAACQVAEEDRRLAGEKVGAADEERKKAEVVAAEEKKARKNAEDDKRRADEARKKADVDKDRAEAHARLAQGQVSNLEDVWQQTASGHVRDSAALAKAETEKKEAEKQRDQAREDKAKAEGDKIVAEERERNAQKARENAETARTLAEHKVKEAEIGRGLALWRASVADRDKDKARADARLAREQADSRDVRRALEDALRKAEAEVREVERKANAANVAREAAEKRAESAEGQLKLARAAIERMRKLGPGPGKPGYEKFKGDRKPGE